ncbi:MAG: hypothetical protein K0S26_2356, partial [Bacteroidota bacterium]|nr:hypothetical protein [Bacteroidota bacterium]
MLKSKCIIAIFICCFIARNALSQQEVSKYEMRWAIFHPFAAKKIKRLLPEAMLVYGQVKNGGILDTFESGGKLDAFRHVFTMALLSQTIKVRKLKKLGIAHEKGNRHHFYKGHQEFGERADSLACIMDLRNNELGFEIGCHNQLVTGNELKDLVITRIKAGNAWYLKRNAKNEYVSCEYI